MFTAHILNIVLWFVLHVSGQYWPFASISNKKYCNRSVRPFVCPVIYPSVCPPDLSCYVLMSGACDDARADNGAGDVWWVAQGLARQTPVDEHWWPRGASRLRTQHCAWSRASSLAQGQLARLLQRTPPSLITSLHFLPISPCLSTTLNTSRGSWTEGEEGTGN